MRWARLVGRAPVASCVLVVVGLGALAIPISELHLAFPTDGTAPRDTTPAPGVRPDRPRRFGPGRDGPLLVVVDGREPADAAATARRRTTRSRRGPPARTASPTPRSPARTRHGTGAQILVTPESAPDDPGDRATCCDGAARRARPTSRSETGTTIGVTGLTAIKTDVSDRLTDALPLYLAVVVGLAFLLLMLVFRSILVPLTATLGFLLSVLATLGATVAVFQEGALRHLSRASRSSASCRSS